MKDYDAVIMVIDKSGSMVPLVDDAIGGINTFLSEQKKVERDAVITMVFFDTEYQEKFDWDDIKKTKKITYDDYKPSGMTALYDALGKTINKVGQKIDSMADDEKPRKVIFAILTDGQENSSVEFNHGLVSDMIKHQTDKYSWEFHYLGANQDAFVVGMSLNIGNTMGYAYTGQGVRSAYSNISRTVSKSRS